MSTILRSLVLLAWMVLPAGTLVAGLLNAYNRPDPAWSNNAMCVWLKSDVGVQTNGSGHAATWIDQSSGGKTTTLAVGDGPLPVYAGLNRKPVLQFHQDRLDTPILAPGSDEATVLAVARVKIKTQYGMFVVFGCNSAGTWNFRQLSTEGKLSLVNGADNQGAFGSLDLQGQ